MPQDRGAKGGAPTSARIETDSLGQIEVAHDRYWGAQTERSRRNFKIGDEAMPKPMIRAIAMVKKAAALTNREIGLLEQGLEALLRLRANGGRTGEGHFGIVPSGEALSRTGAARARPCRRAASR